MPNLVTGQGSDADRADADRAVRDLRELAGRANVSSRLSTLLNQAGDSVASVTATSTPSPEQTTALAAAFTSLDQEVQSACDFPLS